MGVVLFGSSLSAQSGTDPKFTKSLQVQHRGKQSRFTLFHADGWSEVVDKDETSTLLLHASKLDVLATGAKNSTTASLLIQTEKRLTEEEAISRLQSLASAGDNTTFFSVDGWPAFERFEVTRPDKVGAKGRASGFGREEWSFFSFGAGIPADLVWVCPMVLLTHKVRRS